MVLVLAVAYNQPRFCRNASWYPDATTVVNSSVLSYNPSNIFLTKNNAWYIVSGGIDSIRSGIDGSINPTTNASGGFSVFVGGNDHVYAYDNSKHQVNMWSMNLTDSQPVMFTNSSCRDLFVDTNSTLYCTLDYLHHVVAKSLNDPANTSTIVAGTDSPGSTSNMLYHPNGIFVDLNYSLYVADCSNNRIQRFSSGQMNATTIAGFGAPSTISLSCPIHVILDGDGYAFIIDSSNNGIIGSGPDGFRCVVGCTGVSGSAFNQLSNPRSMRFDSYGNIWVADCDNGRIQKFILKINSCGERFPYLLQIERCSDTTFFSDLSFQRFCSPSRSAPSS